jgi:hypothetical protein
VRRLDWFGASAAAVVVLLSTAAWIAAHWPHDSLALLHPLFIATPIFGLVPPCLLLLAVFVAVPSVLTRCASIGLLAWSVPSYLWLIIEDEAKWSRPGVTHWWITWRSFSFLAVGTALGLAMVVARRLQGAVKRTEELSGRR